MSNETVFVKILDKEYQVACPREERQALVESAQLLDERMKAIRGTGAGEWDRSRGYRIPGDVSPDLMWMCPCLPS